MGFKETKFLFAGKDFFTAVAILWLPDTKIIFFKTSRFKISHVFLKLLSISILVIHTWVISLNVKELKSLRLSGIHLS